MNSFIFITANAASCLFVILFVYLVIHHKAVLMIPCVGVLGPKAVLPCIYILWFQLHDIAKFLQILGPPGNTVQYPSLLCIHCRNVFIAFDPSSILLVSGTSWLYQFDLCTVFALTNAFSFIADRIFCLLCFAADLTLLRGRCCLKLQRTVSSLKRIARSVHYWR